jgi:hypothetical protein
VTGLNAKRTSPYGYYVEAVDTQGTASSASDVAQFITASFTSQSANAATAPGTPGTPVATSVGTSGAALAWGAATAGANPVSGYDVYELTPTAHLVAAVGASTTSYALTGLSPSTAYGYEVAALDGTGRISTVTAAAAFTTLGTGATSSPTGSPTSSPSTSTSSSPSTSPTGSPSSSPTISSSPSSSPTSGPTGGAGTCAAAYTITSSWSGGFQASVTVTAGSTAITGWAVKWTLPSGQAITNLWNGAESTSGQNVTVTNAAYNGAVPAASDTSFGFTGSDTGTATAPTSVTCTSSRP